MRVLLTNPPWEMPGRPELWGVRAGSRWPHFQKRLPGGGLPRYIPFPFFLAIAAAALKRACHEPRLLDAVAEGIGEEAFLREIRDFRPELIFVETSTPSLFQDIALLKRLRAEHPSAALACGGSHAPAFAAQMMERESLPDFWLAGEFELGLAALAEALSGRGSFAQIPGLIRKGEGFAGSMGHVADVSLLPQPLYGHLPMHNYSDPVCGLPSPVAQSWLSRGCPYGCTFCVWPQLIYGERRYRARPLGQALDEVEKLISEYACESFYFDDDTANIGEERMAELARLVTGRGLSRHPWAMMARADCMSGTMISRLAEAGLYAVKYGVESVAPQLLNACSKGTRFEKLEEALSATRKAGVKMHLTFSFGLPGETAETIRQTMDFALSVAPESAQFSLCTPFPGTVFYEECVKNGWLVTEDWTRFLGSGEAAVVSTKQLSSDELLAAYEEALSRWQVFSGKRLLARRSRLRRELLGAIENGRRWIFYGERELASFLFEDGAVIANAEVPQGTGQGACAVIVSVHDEEKIFRRLLRDGCFSPQDVLRVYHD